MKKKIIAAGLAVFMGNSLMAMPNVMSEFAKTSSEVLGVPNAHTLTLSLGRAKIRNSGLKGGNVVGIGCENSQKINLLGEELLNVTGASFSYGKMDYETKNGDVPYMNVSVYKQLGKDVLKTENGIFNVYTGLKTQIDLISGLNNKGIGIGPYAGIKYETNDNISAGIHAGVLRDWFEGGKFYTETNIGVDFLYSF